MFENHVSLRLHSQWDICKIWGKTTVTTDDQRTEKVSLRCLLSARMVQNTDIAR